ANLPYNVATPIVSAAVADAGLSRIVVTVQREVARRLVAEPGDDEYGYLSLRVALYADGEILFDLPPGAFRPRPKVTSSVVRLRTKRPPLEGAALDRLLALVSAAFGSRRKTLPNALNLVLGRARAEEALVEIGRLPTARAE